MGEMLGWATPSVCACVTKWRDYSARSKLQLASPRLSRLADHYSLLAIPFVRGHAFRRLSMYLYSPLDFR